MLPPNSSLSALEQFFEDYRSALQNKDTCGLLESFTFHLTFHDSERTVVVPDAEAAEKAFLLLRRYYEDLGMVCLETRFLAPHRVSRDFLLVDIVWRLRDEAAMTICDQRSTFVLREDDNGTKIVSVFHHDDLFPQCGHA
jgi:hypothetical protein